MSQSFEELSGEDVRVSIRHKPACKVELHVKASPFLVKRARKNAIKTVGKEVLIPGFRKGKAPQEIIEKKFPSDIERALHKAIADLAFVQAQKASKVRLLNNNAPVTFDLSKHSEEGAELTFTFETEPAIPSVDAKNFSPKAVDRAEVGEKQIDEAIYQVRFFHAQWKSVERPIQEGDYIMIDLDTMEGETPQRVFHHIRFEVSPERMANWMKQLVLGAKAGDILDGVSEGEGELPPKKVRLSILKVEEAILPELDDAFAKKLGVADVQAMRQSVANLLNARAEEAVRDSLREQVNEFLVSQYSFELPQSLIDAEKKHRLQQMLQDPKFKKQFAAMNEQEKRDFDIKLVEEAGQAVRLFYLSRQVLQEAKIPISHQEVQKMAIATLQAGTHREIAADQISKDIYALAFSKVILAKAQDVILNEMQNAKREVQN